MFLTGSFRHIVGFFLSPIHVQLMSSNYFSDKQGYCNRVLDFFFLQTTLFAGLFLSGLIIFLSPFFNQFTATDNHLPQQVYFVLVGI